MGITTGHAGQRQVSAEQRNRLKSLREQMGKQGALAKTARARRAEELNESANERVRARLKMEKAIGSLIDVKA